MKNVIIIPARWQSSRFPGKPLARIGDKSMIEHVFTRCSQSELAQEVWVATDDDRIFQHVQNFGGNAVMTSPEAATGTDRLVEALSQPDLVDAEYILNVQGDEPLIPPALIDSLLGQLQQKPELSVVTAATPLERAQAANPNIVKVALGKAGFDLQSMVGLYFSRSAIPFERNAPAHSPYWQHIGIYGFHKKALLHFSQLDKGQLEQIESLEQLRFLEHGWDIGVIITNYRAIGVDTEKDLEKVEQALLQQEGSTED